MVRGPVRAGDPRAVQDEDDRQAVQRHVHDRLVEGPLEEGRVDADHRALASHREAGREGHRVLLADADVEDAVRELAGKVEKAGRGGHGGRDGDHVGVPRGGRHQRLPEDVRVGQLGLSRAAAQGIEGAHAVKLVDLVVDGRLVAAALLRDDVDDTRRVQPLRPGQQLLERFEVVAVAGACVLESQAVEDRVGLEQLLQGLLHPEGGLIRLVADQGQLAQPVGDLLLQPLVSRIDLKLGEVPGQATHGGSVGAAVVVQDDDQVGGLKVGDLVQRLPGHTAGQGAVSDHRHHGAGDPVPEPAFGETERIRQRGGRVAVLDQVVFALGPTRIARKAAGLAEAREGGAAASEQLVHVGLMPGVPDDRVPGAVKDAVQRQGQLDHSQIGREVAAGLGDVLDQEGSDLGGERFQLWDTELTDIGRGLDRLKHRST